MCLLYDENSDEFSYRVSDKNTMKYPEYLKPRGAFICPCCNKTLNMTDDNWYCSACGQSLSYGRV